MSTRKKFQDFFKKKNISQKEVAKRLGIGEHSVGKFINKPNFQFLKLISELFPDIDLNYILKDEDRHLIANEPGAGYGVNNEELISKMEDLLRKLRKNLTQK